MGEPTNGNGRNIIPGFSLSAVIQLATILAMISGSWFLMDEKIDNASSTAQDLRTQQSAQAVAIDSRLDAVERNMARLEVQFENVREALVELRRQARASGQTPPVR